MLYHSCNSEATSENPVFQVLHICCIFVVFRHLIQFLLRSYITVKTFMLFGRQMVLKILFSGNFHAIFVAAIFRFMLFFFISTSSYYVPIMNYDVVLFCCSLFYYLYLYFFLIAFVLYSVKSWLF